MSTDWPYIYLALLFVGHIYNLFYCTATHKHRAIKVLQQICRFVASRGLDAWTDEWTGDQSCLARWTIHPCGPLAASQDGAQSPVLLYSDCFVPSAETSADAIQEYSWPCSLFSLGHICHNCFVLHWILRHLCVHGSFWTWIASSLHLRYVVCLDWPRSFPSKWWNHV